MREWMWALIEGVGLRRSIDFCVAICLLARNEA